MEESEIALVVALSPIPFGLIAAYRFYKATFMDIALKRGAALLVLFRARGGLRAARRAAREPGARARVERHSAMGLLHDRLAVALRALPALARSNL